MVVRPCRPRPDRRCPERPVRRRHCTGRRRRRRPRPKCRVAPAAAPTARPVDVARTRSVSSESRGVVPPTKTPAIDSFFHLSNSK